MGTPIAPRTSLRAKKTPGHLLIQLRAHLGWYVGGLAAKAGLSIRQVEALEDRVREARVDTANIPAIARAFGVELYDLVAYLNGQLSLADLLKNRAA